MGKKRVQPLIESDSESGGEAANIESELLSLAKKRRKSNNAKPAALSESDSDWGASKASAGRKKKRTKKVSKSSEEEEDEEEDDWDQDSSEEEAEPPTQPKQQQQQQQTAAARKSQSDSEQEEGEVTDSDESDDNEKQAAAKDSDSDSSSSSSSSSGSSSDSEFNDGYDENLMGDEEDRKRLSGLSEKERETEIFKRIEQRDIMRTRWEIERKLKLARRGEKATKTKTKSKTKTKHKKKAQKKAPSKKVVEQRMPVNEAAVCDKEENDIEEQKEKSKSPIPSDNEQSEGETSTSLNTSGELPSASNLDYFDHKERSKERKKNVEMNRTDDKRSNAMALLKAKREGKAKREEEEARRQAEQEREEEKDELESVSGSKSAVKLKASEIYSDDSGSSDWEEGKPSGKQSRSTSSSKGSSESEDEEKCEKGAPIFISTREELNKLRLSRFKMERFVNLPIFENTVMNCFVRISIGNNGMKTVYRVGEIVGVVETSKIYNLGKTRTNRGLRLKHGTQERVFRLEFISNQEFTETEFEKWRDDCLAHNVPMPTVGLIERKQLDIKDALNYEFKDEDVEKIIEEKNRFRNRPTNYAMRKTCLMKERDAVLLRGDYDLARELGHQIEELESRASELDKKRSSSLSLISYINDRNRKRNVEDAEKAILEEARANKGLRSSDPFTRRITQPRMGFKANDKKEDSALMRAPILPPPMRKRPEAAIPTGSGLGGRSGGSGGVGGGGSGSGSGSEGGGGKPGIRGIAVGVGVRRGFGSAVPSGDTSANGGLTGDVSASGNSKTPTESKDYSLYSLHDFDIDLDVALPVNPVNVLPKPVPKVEVTPKRSLNLEDYKKKRGLI